MMYSKGFSFSQVFSGTTLIGHALAVRLALGAILLALASMVPVSHGPFAAAAQAKDFPASCGREGQAPCPLLGPNRHVPSCMPGLSEKPLGERCTATTPITLPTIIPKPEQVAGCGAKGEKPCLARQALPSCEGTLVEDFVAGSCRRNDGDIVNMSKNALREVGPILKTIAYSAVQCGVDTIMLNAKAAGPALTVARLQALPCFNAMLDQARQSGYQTLTIGGGGGAAFGVGAEGENGFAFDTAKRRPITTYHTLSLKFLSIGAGASVTVGLFKKDNLNFGGDAHGAAVGFAAVGGGGAAVWFDYRNDKVQGANAIITAGGRADLAYIRNTTQVLPTQYAIQQAISPLPAPMPAIAWNGSPVEGYFRAASDARDLVREFRTGGTGNTRLYYRYKTSAQAWSAWRNFELVSLQTGGFLYRENGPNSQGFRVSPDLRQVTWVDSPDRNRPSFTMTREDDFTSSGIIFSS